MKKEDEKDVLDYLEKSNDYWTDLFLIIDKSKGSYSQYFILLKSMSNDGLIEFRKYSEIGNLKFTMKSELTSIPDLSAKITDKGKDYLSCFSRQRTKKKNKILKIISASLISTNRGIYYILGSIAIALGIYLTLKQQFDIDLIQLIEKLK